MIAEKNAEKAETNKQHQKDIETIRREHKKEMDVSSINSKEPIIEFQ